MFIVVPDFVEWFLKELTVVHPVAEPMRLIYCHGCPYGFPVTEDGLMPHGAYGEKMAIILGIGDDWQELQTEDGPAYNSRREAIMDVLNTIAHEYAHHIQFLDGKLPDQMTEESEKEAEAISEQIMAKIKIPEKFLEDQA